MQYLRTILQQLHKTNLTVKPQKCQPGMAECRAVATGPASPVLAGPLFSQGKIKLISFYTKQVTSRSARIILALLGLLYYSTVNRKAVSRAEKLLATHARDLF